MNVMAALLLSILPQSEPLRDRCDVLWVDHFYSDDGRPVFTQLIFVDFVDGPGLRTHEEIVGFYCPLPSHPERDGKGGWYVLIREQLALRRIEAPYIRETWTQSGVTGDLEIKAREVLPVHERRGLKPVDMKAVIDKITGRGGANLRIPNHAQLYRSMSMSEQQSSCAQSEKPEVEYRDIPGIPGYRIGNDGTLWTCRQTRRGMTDTWKQIFGSAWGQQGYIMATLQRDGKSVRRMIQHLVLEAFVGPRPDGLLCLHDNDVADDNRLSNLSWGTREKNYRDRDRNGGTAKGEAAGQAKLTEEAVIRMRELAASGAVYADLAVQFGCNYRNVSAIVRGQTWAHVGGPITRRGRNHCEVEAPVKPHDRTELKQVRAASR